MINVPLVTESNFESLESIKILAENISDIRLETDKLTQAKNGTIWIPVGILLILSFASGSVPNPDRLFL